MSAPEEIDWARLDKTKFYFYGIGLFSGVTTCLYPLSVLKTRQMALPGPGGLGGVKQTAITLWRMDGIRAFYKGFGTVCVGTMPARVLYMSTLELVKTGVNSITHRLPMSDVGAAGTVNFLAGGLASMSSQLVYVPVDVVSQRLMVLNNPTCQSGKRMNGISMARLIIREEGIRGLWRGFSASLMTFVPNSALWWGSYGVWQRLIWHQVDFWGSTGQVAALSISEAGADTKKLPAENKQDEVSFPDRPTSTIVGVQTGSALLAGATSACFTTPLDVIKTRLQLGEMEDGVRPTITGTVKSIFKEGGLKGFARGIVPRIANVSLWGTSMVSAYELLKRLSVRDG
ncbi:hypothetical protein BSKO_05486 [Bryopsis sp. KO-2023]|nr:hypothetical protein BSKO_05486 [Bryopsis sp. KO-2023]